MAIEPVVSENPGLCHQCKRLNLRHYLAPERLRTLWGLSNAISLETSIDHASVNSPCALCRMLARSIQHIPDARVGVLQFKTFGATQTLQGKETAAYFMRASVPDALRIAPLAIDSFRLGALRYTYGRLVQRDQLDRKLVAKWLQHCESTHKQCSTIVHDATHIVSVPQYVVDVVDMRIKEVEGERLRYLALSYVWGGTNSLQLLKSNLADLNTPYSLQDRLTHLSKVVKDAIIFTREIGERFLWVDSLCICQDDASTKHGQISAMNSIYAKATLTLVALEGDASYGLPGVEPYASPRHQQVETVHGIRIVTVMPDINEIECGSVWRSRAWTYQEEQFSRRLLFFTEHQVYFRCQRATFCEDRYEELESPPPAKRSVMRIRLMGDDDSHHLGLAYIMWRHLVENFSTREFSFEIDRYNAFAGLENELRVFMNYPCVMGMPIQNLVHNLYWAHDNDTAPRVRRIVDYPSWSWCGWTGGVASLRKQIEFNITEVGLSNHNSLTYDSDGRFTTKEVKPDDLDFSDNLSLDCTQPFRTLAFAAYSAKIPLETSQHATSGVILITPKPGKVCGIIQAQHLPSSALAGLSSTSKCIMVGSCETSDIIDPCQFARMGSSTVQHWFRPPKQTQQKRPLSIGCAAAHEPHPHAGGALQRLRRASTWLHTTADSKNDTRAGTWWEVVGRPAVQKIAYRICTAIWKIHLYFLCIPIVIISGVVLLVTLWIASALAISIIMLMGLACQKVFNYLSRTKKWHFWTSMKPDNWFKRLVEDDFIFFLPQKAQEWFERVYRGPDVEMATAVFDPDMFPDFEMPATRISNSNIHSNPDVEKAQAATEKPLNPKTKLVNLILISESKTGDGAYHRVAIGAMSAVCWQECYPLRQRIVLK
jgi:hypothetical protein